MKAFHRTQTQALFSLNAENAFGLNMYQKQAVMPRPYYACWVSFKQIELQPKVWLVFASHLGWQSSSGVPRSQRASSPNCLWTKLFSVGRQKGRVAFFEKWLSDLASLDSGSAHAPSLRSLPQSSSDVRCSPSLCRKKCEFSEQIISFRSPSYLCPSNWK